MRTRDENIYLDEERGVQYGLFTRIGYERFNYIWDGKAHFMD